MLEQNNKSLVIFDISHLRFLAMAVKSSERQNCWPEVAITLTRHWLISMGLKCFSEMKLKILFHAALRRIKICQNASKIFIPPVNEFVKLQETSPNSKKNSYFTIQI